LLALLASPALLVNHASAATLTWNGADGGAGDWSAANWVSGTTPAAGDLLQFGGTTTPITNNNITADTNFIGINLTNNGSAGQTSNFTLSGNRITLGGDIATTAMTSGSLTDTISLAMILSASRTITTNTNHNLTISGVISESGGARVLTKAGAGTLTLNGNNTFSGGVSIINSGGKVIVGHNNALGTGTVTLNGTGPTIELVDGITVANNMTVIWRGNAKFLQLQSGATSATYSGNITNDEDVVGNFDMNVGTGGTLTVSGIISNLGFEKTGVGTLILSGNNTFTTGLTLTAGVLNIRHDNALGTTAAGTSVASGAALELQGAITIGAEALSLSGNGISTAGALRNISGDNTYGGDITLAAASRIHSDAGLLTLSGAIGGAGQNLTIAGAGNTTITSAIGTSNGTLTKGGAGTLTLNGTNTYTGTTTVNAGTLTLNSGSAIADNAAVTMQNATATVLNVNSSETIGTLSGGGSLGGNIAIASGQTLTVNQTSNGTFSGIMSGAGGLTKNGTGQLTLNGTNTYTGMTTINSATLRVESAGNIGGDITIAGGRLGMAASNRIADTSAVTMTSGTADFGIYNEIISNMNMSGGQLRKAAGTLVLSSASSFTGGLVNMTAAGSQIQTGTDGTTTLGDVTFNYSSTGNATGGLWVRSDISVNANTTANFTNSGGGLGRFNLDNSTRTIDVGSGGTVNMGWTIVNPGTASGITKNGSGSLVLTANNTYTGTTTINEGTIQMGHANGLGSGGNITFGGGALQYGSGITTDISSRLKNSGSAILIDTNSNDVTFASAVDSTNTLGLTKNGSGTLTLSGNNTYSGTTTINAGTVEISTTGLLGGGSYAGNIVNTGAFLISSNSNQTLSGAISGIGALTKNGSSTLTLTGNNSYNGMTTINAGTIRLQNTASNSQTIVGDITVSGGQLSLAATNQIADTASVTLTSGSIELSTYNETINSLTMSGGSLRRSTNTLALNSASSFTGGALNFASNTARIITNATSTLGNVTFDFSVASGTSTLGLVLGSGITVNADTTANFTNSGGGLGRIDLNGAERVIDVGAAGTMNVGWSVAGTSAGITKNGTGTLVLNANNTYTGGTVINSGTLEAAHAGALGSNNTVQVTGGTLLVTADDAINGKNIQMGGSGIGLQFSGNYSGAIGNLTLSANSIIDLGAGSVQILFQGLTSSNHTLSFYNWSGTVGGNGTADTDKVYFGPDLSDEALAKIYFYSGPGDSFLGSGFDLGLKATGFAAPWDEGFQIIPGSTVPVVPEPETYATGLLLLLGGAWWMWRNRKLEAGNRKA
jgi:autotransporter-associated beta strand protein